MRFYLNSLFSYSPDPITHPLPRSPARVAATLPLPEAALLPTRRSISGIDLQEAAGSPSNAHRRQDATEPGRRHPGRRRATRKRRARHRAARTRRTAAGSWTTPAGTPGRSRSAAEALDAASRDAEAVSLLVFRECGPQGEQQLDLRRSDGASAWQRLQ